eukprot:scaffold245_cov256-Pinguiococcus_pyrenoidosus.AAC.42
MPHVAVKKCLLLSSSTRSDENESRGRPVQTLDKAEPVSHAALYGRTQASGRSHFRICRCAVLATVGRVRGDSVLLLLEIYLFSTREELYTVQPHVLPHCGRLHHVPESQRRVSNSKTESRGPFRGSLVACTYSRSVVLRLDTPSPRSNTTQP